MTADTAGDAGDSWLDTATILVSFLLLVIFFNIPLDIRSAMEHENFQRPA